MSEAPLYMATSNVNKFNEVQKMLSKSDLRIVMVRTKPVEIQSDDLADIAVASAMDVRSTVNGKILVEDAGLFIKILNGFPGPYSSYVYKTLGCKGVLRLIGDNDSREAEFRSSLAYIEPKGKVRIFKGFVKGLITSAPEGEDGFGFDPIFIPKQADRTFGVMSITEKNSYSHRGMAISEFVKWYLRLKK